MDRLQGVAPELYLEMQKCSGDALRDAAILAARLAMRATWRR
jgi:hypothetical protein